METRVSEMLCESKYNTLNTEQNVYKIVAICLGLSMWTYGRRCLWSATETFWFLGWLEEPSQ